MKKILLLLLCFMIIGGCEKKMNLIEKTKGYEIEKIASIPFETNDNMKRVISYDNEQLYIEDIEMLQGATIIYHSQVDMNTYEIHKLKSTIEQIIPNELNEKIIKQTPKYKIVERNKFTINDEYSVIFHGFYYISNNQTITLYEKESKLTRNDEEHENFSTILCDDDFDVLVYNDSNKIYAYKILDGNLDFMMEKRLDEENYHLLNVEKVGADLLFCYQNGGNKKYVIGNETYEGSSHDEILVLDDYVIITTYAKDWTISQTRIIDRQSQKENIVDKGVALTMDFENNTFLSLKENQYSLIQISEDALVQYPLPFDSTFEFVQADKNRYIGYQPHKGDIYEITIKEKQ